MYKKDDITYTFFQLQELYKDTSFPNSGPDSVWLADNGFSEIEDTVVEPSEEQKQQDLVYQLTTAVQNYMDNVARTRRYDNMMSLVSYAGDSDPVFNEEGTAGKLWRSACWIKCKEIEAAVLANQRSVPTEQELVTELPVFTWISSDYLGV